MRLIGLCSTLLAMCLVSHSVPLSASAKQPTLRGLVRQEPLFDSTFVSDTGPFKIKVEETRWVNPVKAQKLLHGKAVVVNLHGDTSGTVLRGKMDDSVVALKGKVDATGKPLQGKADETGTPLKGKLDQSGVPLKGKVDTTGAPLKGKVTDEGNPQTPLNTLEHAIRPTFMLDLKKLEAEAAPTISYQLESELEAARRKVAGQVEPEVRMMESELHKPQPRPDVPAVPAKVNVAVDVTKNLQNELTKSVHSATKAVEKATKQLKLAFAKATPGTAPAMPLVPANGLPGAPDIPKKHAPGIPATRSTTTNIDVTSAKKQMEAELRRANQRPPSDAELDAQMEAAKRHSQVVVNATQPAMDTVLTRLRNVPVAKIPNGNAAEDVHGDATASVEWDKWHANFANLARGPILSSLTKLPNSTGIDTVEITVSRDHHLTAKIVQASGNAAYDQAILQAYRSLDGNGGLEYPRGSKRKSIRFSIDNEHKGAGKPSAVNSTTAVGDKEFIRY